MGLFALCCSGATCPCSSYLYSKYFMFSIYQEHENIWITFTLLLLQYFSISCYDKVSLNVSWETIAMIIWHIAWKIDWGDCLTFHTHCCSLGGNCGVISKREVSKSRDFATEGSCLARYRGFCFMGKGWYHDGIYAIARLDHLQV